MRNSALLFACFFLACASAPSPDAAADLPPAHAATANGAGHTEAATPDAPSQATEEQDAQTAQEAPSDTQSTQTAEPGTQAPEQSPGEDPADEEASADAKPKRPERIVLDTVYDDRRVGNDQTAQIEAELGLVQDEALNRYVHSVAVRLLRYAPTRPFEWEFKIVDQTVPNAFALPGGKIYVSRGLLALVETEDELAGVIGHEITHSAERHAAARIEQIRRINPFSIGLYRAAAIAAYGRDQERDADRGGQLLAARAGYDPKGISTFLRKLDAAERYELGYKRIPYFLATHPTSPERSALTSDRAAGLEWKPAPPVASDRPFGYYSVIDGLVLGEDPAGGIFEGARFIHPELRFSIRFPEGWETLNSQQAVTAVSPARDAQASLTVEGSLAPEPAEADAESAAPPPGAERDKPSKSSKPRRPPTTLDEVVDAFLEREVDGIRVRVQERTPIRLGDLPAIRVEGSARSSGPGPSLHVQMTFVAYNGLVYRLSLLSLPGAAGDYRGRARSFAKSFRPLDEVGARSLEVTRLRIARALENETLKALSERTKNELELVYTGVMNALYADTPLPKGKLIKIGLAEPYLPRPKESVKVAQPRGPRGEP